MLDDVLARVFTEQWLVVLIVGVILLGFSELGYRFGLRLHKLQDEPRRSQIGGIQGAVLGLLGLLLGFTFSIAVGRYEHRRELVLQEANAIGTTYLRASFLPNAQQQTVKELLRRYVDLRLTFYANGTNEAARTATETAAAKIQAELWAQTVAAAREDATPLMASFVAALNETIDLDATRLAASRTRVPGVVWLLVLMVASVGCCVCGYGAGSSGSRSGFANILLPLLLAVVVTLIADFDRPHRGLIGISQRPLLDLQQSFRFGSDGQR